MVDTLSEPNMGFAEGRDGRLVERQLLRLAEAGFVVRAAGDGGDGRLGREVAWWRERWPLVADLYDDECRVMAEAEKTVGRARDEV